MAVRSGRIKIPGATTIIEGVSRPEGAYRIFNSGDSMITLRLAPVEKHRFGNYEKTGELEFRRHGQAEVWKESVNFSEDVLQLAQEILGSLRAGLGYTDS